MSISFLLDPIRGQREDHQNKKMKGISLLSLSIILIFSIVIEGAVSVSDISDDIDAMLESDADEHSISGEFLDTGDSWSLDNPSSIKSDDDLSPEQKKNLLSRATENKKYRQKQVEELALRKLENDSTVSNIHSEHSKEASAAKTAAHVAAEHSLTTSLNAKIHREKIESNLKKNVILQEYNPNDDYDSDDSKESTDALKAMGIDTTYDDTKRYKRNRSYEKKRKADVEEEYRHYEVEEARETARKRKDMELNQLMEAKRLREVHAQEAKERKSDTVSSKLLEATAEAAVRLHSAEVVNQTKTTQSSQKIQIIHKANVDVIKQKEKEDQEAKGRVQNLKRSVIAAEKAAHLAEKNLQDQEHVQEQQSLSKKIKSTELNSNKKQKSTEASSDKIIDQTNIVNNVESRVVSDIKKSTTKEIKEEIQNFLRSKKGLEKLTDAMTDELVNIKQERNAAVKELNNFRKKVRATFQERLATLAERRAKEQQTKDRILERRAIEKLKIEDEDLYHEKIKSVLAELHQKEFERREKENRERRYSDVDSERRRRSYSRYRLLEERRQLADGQDSQYSQKESNHSDNERRRNLGKDIDLSDFDSSENINDSKMTKDKTQKSSRLDVNSSDSDANPFDATAFIQSDTNNIKSKTSLNKDSNLIVSINETRESATYGSMALLNKRTEEDRVIKEKMESDIREFHEKMRLLLS